MAESLDFTAERKAELSQAIANAFAAKDDDAASQAIADYAEYVQQSIIEQATLLSTQQLTDTQALMARGVRTLTGPEQNWYNKLIGAMTSSNPTQSISGLDVTMPETVIEAIFEDISDASPLLNAIDIQNTNGAIRMFVNKGGVQLAVWGKLTGEFKTELEGAIEEVDTTLYKLQAFIPVSKAMLNLGASWIDRYVRAILAEACVQAMENAVINGTGSDEPIGMIREVGSSATVTNGEYAEKTAIAVTSFSAAKYGALVAQLTTNSETGRYRRPDGLILVCSPTDYYTTIMPATTMLTPQGTYVQDVLPVPTKVIQSQQCPVGKAILGIGKRYFLPIGKSNKNGTIEYNDSVQFLEDNRVYTVRLYGNGMPLDNNAFIVLDISDLAPARLPVITYTESADVDTTEET